LKILKIIYLDPEEVASSSPQIQKVLNDIQGIKNLPADQARNTCMKICSGI
jgi:predicted RNA-binding protein with EMAP domain